MGTNKETITAASIIIIALWYFQKNVEASTLLDEIPGNIPETIPSKKAPIKEPIVVPVPVNENVGGDHIYIKYPGLQIYKPVGNEFIISDYIPKNIITTPSSSLPVKKAINTTLSSQQTKEMYPLDTIGILKVGWLRWTESQPNFLGFGVPLRTETVYAGESGWKFYPILIDRENLRIEHIGSELLATNFINKTVWNSYKVYTETFKYSSKKPGDFQRLKYLIYNVYAYSFDELRRDYGEPSSWK